MGYFHGITTQSLAVASILLTDLQISLWFQICSPLSFAFNFQQWFLFINTILISHFTAFFRCIIRLANSGFGHIPGLPPFPSPPSFPFPGPTPKPARGHGERCKLPIGVWGKAAADKRFVAYLSQKEQLWWQQFLCVFIRINLHFCTNTRLLSSSYSVSLRAKHSVGSRG